MHSLRWTTMALVGVVAVACKREPAPRPTAPAEVTAGSDGRVAVTVDAQGYHPSTIHATPGRALTLVFTRVSDDGCGQQLRFPSLNLQRDLALNVPVEVSFTPTAGTVAFTCGMSMYQGTVLVR